MNSPERIVDANANRAREALRVMEEAARFVLDDTALASKLKTMRHDLAHAAAQLPSLIHHRDTPNDVGTTLTTPAEMQRAGTRDVVNAAAARLSEALRAIEEYAKTLDDPHAADLAATAEQLRYRGYNAAQQLARALGTGNAKQWKLCLLLTQSLCTHHTWQSVLQHAVSNGTDCIQVREKDLDDQALLDHVREVITLVDKQADVIVNDRPDIALLAGAQGVHLGQTDLSPIDTRQLVGDRLLIGVSTASLNEAKRARAQGADYCGVGPMYHTATKHKPTLAGPAYLRDYLAWDAIPHLAIGGINPDNVHELADVGCRGIAVSSAICSAEDPGAVTASLSETITASTGL